MKNLQERIQEAIEIKAAKYGLMGTETVTIEMKITDAEKSEFYTTDWNNHYEWEIDGNLLKISYREETGTMIINNSEYDWEVVVNLMDDEIRESVHADLAPCSNQEFFSEYCERHFEKYNEEFHVN